jgi:hypothetical protein
MVDRRRDHHGWRRGHHAPQRPRWPRAANDDHRNLARHRHHVARRRRWHDLRFAGVFAVGRRERVRSRLYARGTRAQANAILHRVRAQHRSSSGRRTFGEPADVRGLLRTPLAVHVPVGHPPGDGKRSRCRAKVPDVHTLRWRTPNRWRGVGPHAGNRRFVRGRGPALRRRCLENHRLGTVCPPGDRC